ncbi:hypothetical protein MTO96_013459 [Rhipicephalus appendiculatus]
MVPATLRDTGGRRRCCCRWRWPAAERCATTPRDDGRCARDQGCGHQLEPGGGRRRTCARPRRSGFADAQVAGGPTHELETKVSCLRASARHGGCSVATHHTALPSADRTPGTLVRHGKTMHLLRQDG